MNIPEEKTIYSKSSEFSSSEPDLQIPRGQFFEFRIKGRISHIWSDWFEGLTIQDLDDGEMLLSGLVVDQSALMGILNKLVRLNLTLLSLNEIKNKEKK